MASIQAKMDGGERRRAVTEASKSFDEFFNADSFKDSLRHFQDVLVAARIDYRGQPRQFYARLKV